MNEYLCWSCGDLGKHNRQCKSSCKTCNWKCRENNDGRYNATIRDKILGIGCNCNQSMSMSVPDLEQHTINIQEQIHEVDQGLAAAQSLAIRMKEQYATMKKVASRDRISRLRIHGLSPRGLSQSMPDEVTS